MLDIKFIRDHADAVKKAARNKGVEVDIDKLLQLDDEVRKSRGELDESNRRRNELAGEGAKGKPSDENIKEGRRLKDEAAHLQVRLDALSAEFQELILKVPNISSEDTPIGPDESGNKVLREWGKPRDLDFEPKEHWELGEKLDVIDNERASQVSGSRFTYLKGPLVLMQFALIQHALSVFTDEEVLRGIIKTAGLDVSPKPFIPIVPPVMIRPEVMQKMARLEPREERYHMPADDLYLVGSAEHTLGPMHMGEVLKEEALPIRYIGYSTAFRREAGSYGKDMRGILRVHQFDKLEMESFSLPEDSIKEQDFFVAIQEYLVRSLEIPYRVMAICTGDMGGPDARQIDIEMWMPGQNKYRETHTADLMTDYQARRLNTKVKRGDGSSELVHMNDATALAIGRTLVAILENYQTADGTIRVPHVLQKYMGGLEEIGTS